MGHPWKHCFGVLLGLLSRSSNKLCFSNSTVNMFYRCWKVGNMKGQASNKSLMVSKYRSSLRKRIRGRTKSRNASVSAALVFSPFSLPLALSFSLSLSLSEHLIYPVLHYFNISILRCQYFLLHVERPLQRK